MLDNFLASLPKNVLATVAILIGIGLILLLKPPHSKCDTQKELFRENVQKYFFIEYKKRELIKKNRFTSTLNECRFDGKPGSCFDFFDLLRKLNRELVTVSDQCMSEIVGAVEIKSALWDGAEVMTRLAWGEKPPDSYAERQGWLSEADIALFCGVKRQLIRAFGSERWRKFRESQFKKLPGADQLSRNEVWARILFSVKCLYL